MKLLKGAHLTTNYTRALAAELGAARVLGTAPFHYQFQQGNYNGVDALGIPIVRHVYDLRAVISTEAAQNLQNMPHGAEWLVGNEPDLPYDEGGSHWDAQTPAEAADYLIRNMDVVTQVADANAKYILAAGSQDAIDNGWFVQYVNEIRARRPDVLAKFSAVGVHFYAATWQTAEDAIAFVARAKKQMNQAGLGTLDVWITEFGLGLDWSIANACDYVTEFFTEVAYKQDKGNWLWLKFVSWFLANRGYIWTTYHTLTNAAGELSRVGRRFRDA